MSPERVSVGEEGPGKVIPCRGTENRKGAGTTVESGARNLEAERRVRDGVQS